MYEKGHLLSWLKYRGDSLKSLGNIKDIRCRVLHYFKNNIDNNIVDPTSDLKWKTRKVELLGKKLLQKNPTVSEVPEVLRGKLGPLTSTIGWVKSLEGLPRLTINEIELYLEKVSSKNAKKFTSVKKNFERGGQFLSESYIDLDSIYVMRTDELFCLKAVCAASLKKQDRWITVAISTVANHVEFAQCQCPAGKGGTCAHSFAFLKLIANWVLERRQEVPAQDACTSRPCLWSVPKSRDRVEKVPVADINVISPQVNKNNTSQRKRKAGVETTLYEARSAATRSTNVEKVKDLFNDMKNENSEIPFVSLLDNVYIEKMISTKFGQVPVGSVISNQCPQIPSDFKIYCSIDHQPIPHQFCVFPDFPMHESPNLLDSYLNGLSDSEQKFIETLQVTSDQVDTVEKGTRDQANNPDWFKYRKGRFTASLNNVYRNKNPKTDKGFESLAKSIVKPSKHSSVLTYKLNFGKYYEPVAIQKYELYMKSVSHFIQVESCGLVIDNTNFVLAATPDGKVVDVSEKEIYGILEVKCSEEYKDVDPADIIFISKTSPIFRDTTGLIRLRKDHSYYDQITMQMAMTTRSWCDFVLYTSKGLVIDRVYFDPNHWAVLSRRILEFYFHFLLKEYIDS